jgi:hypothetical protein
MKRLIAATLGILGSAGFSSTNDAFGTFKAHTPDVHKVARKDDAAAIAAAEAKRERRRLKRSKLNERERQP